VAADGNWIHIHYQSKLQAKKVLSKNGKVFGGSIMVGVAPCIDKVCVSLEMSFVAVLWSHLKTHLLFSLLVDIVSTH